MHYNRWEPIVYRILLVVAWALGLPAVILLAYSFGR